MTNQLMQLEQPITYVVPHVFKRPLLHVNPSDSFLTVTTFLALGPQIYVDGLVVLDGRKAAGIIGGRHAIEYILYHQKNWMQGTASSVMSHLVPTLDAGSPLGNALDVFRRTGFAFLPITINQDVATVLSVRDILRLVADSELKTPVSQLSSKVISLSNDASIGNALELMSEHYIRNVVVNYGNRQMVVNDRKILEYFLCYRGRQTLSSKGLKGLFETGIGTLALVDASQTAGTTAASAAAGRLLDVNTPCLLLENDEIVTPWDIVMKGFVQQRA